MPSPSGAVAELHKMGHDYEGSSFVVMEELDFDKVVACWPQREQAAVAPLEDFLSGATLEQLKKPTESIIPPEEWPKFRRVMSVPLRRPGTGWSRKGITRAFSKLCPESELLRGPDGRMILNGAGAVPKMKGDTMCQRFISIFCPLHSVSTKITGDGEVVIDSEDMASAFNLFQMPIGWRGLFCYEKQVPAHCLGLEGDTPTYASLRNSANGMDICCWRGASSSH